jgi:hypothetical protein
MLRTLSTFLLGMLCLAPLARAADTPTGTWRLSVPVESRQGKVTLNLLMLFSEGNDGKWTADLLDVTPSLGAEPQIELNVKDEHVKFAIKFGSNNWTFDGKVQPGGKKIKGSLNLGGITLVELLPSKLKSLTKDPFAVAKEALEQSDDSADFFNALPPVLSAATEKKLKPEEIRAFTDKAAKLAEAYGPRWQRTVAFRIADVLAGQEGFAPIAIEQARQAERLLSRSDDIGTQLQTLDSVARVLRRVKKDADAQEVEGRIAKLEPRDYLEYARTHPPFKPEEFKGRKAAGSRAALVELFTGAECGPCYAVDVAADGLIATFKPTDVILLQYHAHIPGPDPLASRESMERLNYYMPKDDDKGTPAIFFSGKQDETGGGGRDPKVIRQKYQAYRAIVEQIIEKPVSVKLTAAVTRKGDEFVIKANADDLEKPGEKVTLRFAVAEERIRYEGGNGIRYHHHVVRAMPGGVKGFPLTKKANEQSVTIKVEDLRKAQNAYLDEITKDFKTQAPDFTFEERPVSFRNLRVVAFVQNDETKEVLQAVQVELEGKE